LTAPAAPTYREPSIPAQYIPALHYLPLPPRALHSLPTRRSSDLTQVDLAGGHQGGDLLAGFPLDVHIGIRVQAVLGQHVVQHIRSEEHTSELQSRFEIVCRLPLERNKLHS